MSESSGAHAATPASTESVDSLLCAVAAAPARVPPASGAFASPFAEGAEVGRYRLVRELGRGGMGSVWHAEHRVTKKRVALKIVRDGVALTPELRSRFEREARLVTAVDHPGVVEVHDMFEAPGGWPVLVMEMLSGETLGRWLARAPRSVPEVAAVLAEVVAIVADAHRAGVVHRDLKPENVFLCSEPGASRVRVLDFGIARLLDVERSPAEVLTDTGVLLGTPPYMSPEQLLGERSVDDRADVWALGVMLYECLVGERPVAGGNVGQVVRNLHERGVPSLDRSRFPAALVDCASAMLEIDRARRCDLDAVHRVLVKAARGDLAPPSPVRRVAAGFRRSSRFVAVVGAVGLWLAVAAWARSQSVGSEPGGPPSSKRVELPAAALPVAELTVATVMPKASLVGRVLDAWQRSLSKRTGGKLDVSVRWAGAASARGGERSALSRLKTGQIDGAVVSADALPSIVPAAAAVELPGVIDSWTKVDWVRAHFRDVLGSEFDKEGYRLLSFHDEGCRRILSRGRPVRRVSDLARRRVAALDTDPFSAVVFSSVPGSVAVSLADADVSASLGDASRLGTTAIIATAGEAERSGWTRSLDAVTMVPVACTSGAFVLRTSSYRRLSDDERAAVDDVSARAEEAAGPRARQDDMAASLRLVRALVPVEPSAPERRDWERLFAKAAALYAQRGVPPELVEQAEALAREIDTLE